VLLRDGTDPGQVVHDPGVRRAGRAHHGRHVGQVVLGVQRLPEGLTGEPVVGRGHDERVHLQQAERVDDGGVGVAADDDPQPPTRRGAVPALGDLARHSEGREVAGGPPGHEAAARLGREPGQVGDQTQHLILGGDDPRRLEPGDALNRGARDQHVEKQRGLGRGRRDEAEETWAVSRDDGRSDDRRIDAEHLVGLPTFLGNQPAEQALQLLRRAGAAIQRHRVEPQPVLCERESAADDAVDSLVDRVHGDPPGSGSRIHPPVDRSKGPGFGTDPPAGSP
jgi:hypothetical protein